MNIKSEVIDIFPIPTFLIDKADFRIIYYNKKGLLLTHLNEDSLKKSHISDFIDKQFLQVGEFNNCCFKLNEQPSITGNLTVQASNKNNLIVSFWNNNKTDKDSKDKPDTDKTKDDLEITKACIELSTDSIFIMRNHIILYANRHLLNIAGYELSDLIGQKFTTFVAPKEIEKVKSLFADRKKKGITYQKFESCSKYKNGEINDVEVSVVSVIFEGKQAIQVILRDITKQKIAERKYQNIINFAPIGFYQSTQDGTLTIVNDRLANILGYDNSKDIISKDISEFFFTKGEREELIKKYDTPTSAEIENLEIKFRKKNGDAIWVQLTSKAIKDKKGVTLFYDGFIIDITPRKEIEKGLLQKEHALSSSINAIVLSDIDGKMTYANNAALQMWGYDKNEIKGKLITSFWEGNHIKNTIRNIKKNGQDIGEVTAKRKDGSLFDVQYSANLVKDIEGNAINIFGSFIDISVRKKRENIEKLLLNLSKKSFLNIDLKSYLELIHKELKKIMKADNFYVALYDKTSDKYSFPYFVDLYEDYNNKTPVYLHHSLTNLVRETKQGLLITEKIEKELNKKQQINLIGEPSPIWLGVPLMDSSNDDAIGVLALQDYKDEKAYNKEDLQTLEIIAANIGIFIDRIKNQEQQRQAKITAEDGEKRYKSLFYDNKSVMLILNPKTGDIVDANKSACDYYGYTYQELIALKIQQINTLSDKEVKAEMQKSISEKKQYFNFKHRLASGKIKDVEVYSSNIRTSEKDLIYSIVHDISKRKLAEEKVLTLSTAIEQSPISLIITDLTGKIEYANPYYAELTGYDREELIGKNPNIVSSGIQDKTFYKNLWDIILSGNKWQNEICNKKKNGDLFWEQAIISPIINKHGKIMHFVGIKKDITERKKMIEELILAKEKAEESNRLKTAFLANMGHEIRTPMNGILGFSDLLLKSKLDKKTKESYIKIINQSGKRLLNTVTNIVEISKIETGIVKIRESDFNIYESVKNIVRLFRTQAEEKGLTFSFNKENLNTNLTIYSDEVKFKSILTNLIKNAIKYTDKGKIEVKCHLENKSITFCVKDTGIGIPKDRQEAIFNPFEQADIEDTKVFEGSGLGLAISKSYTEILKGDLWVTSVEGEGSEFYFRIPITTHQD